MLEQILIEMVHSSLLRALMSYSIPVMVPAAARAGSALKHGAHELQLCNNKKVHVDSIYYNWVNFESNICFFEVECGLLRLVACMSLCHKDCLLLIYYFNSPFRVAIFRFYPTGRQNHFNCSKGRIKD